MLYFYNSARKNANNIWWGCKGEVVLQKPRLEGRERWCFYLAMAKRSQHKLSV